MVLSMSAAYVFHVSSVAFVTFSSPGTIDLQSTMSDRLSLENIPDDLCTKIAVSLYSDDHNALQFSDIGLVCLLMQKKSNKLVPGNDTGVLVAGLTDIGATPSMGM